MSYRVIYLDGREIKEKGRLPEIECDVCQKIKRNVIEPVAIFVEEKKVEEIENKLIELQKKFGNQEEILKEKVKELAKEIHKEQDGETCVFHCRKENEIWIENVEEYRQWKERRDKALKEGKDFDEEIKIKWNKNLVDEFWRRVRAYRFAVDYADLWEKSGRSWNKFIENIRNGDMAGKPGIIELKKK